MQLKGKKSTTSHTVFWVPFFPFLGYNTAGICPPAFLTELGDRITHIQETHTVKLAASHSRACCCQLAAIFFPPRVHLPIKGDWNKQLRFMTLSYLVLWNLFHLEKEQHTIHAASRGMWSASLFLMHNHNPASFSSWSQVNAKIRQLINGFHYSTRCWGIKWGSAFLPTGFSSMLPALCTSALSFSSHFFRRYSQNLPLTFSAALLSGHNSLLNTTMLRIPSIYDLLQTIGIVNAWHS